MKDEGAIKVSRCEAGYIVAVNGTGTRQRSPAVRDFISGAIEDGAQVVLDLNQCDYLDSTFLGCLVVLHKRGCACGTAFRVCADEGPRKKLLHPTRLDQVLEFCESPEPDANYLELPVLDLERQEFGKHLLETHEELSKVESPSSAAFEKVTEQLRRELGES